MITNILIFLAVCFVAWLSIAFGGMRMKEIRRDGVRFYVRVESKILGLIPVSTHWVGLYQRNGQMRWKQVPTMEKPSLVMKRWLNRELMVYMATSPWSKEPDRV